MYECNSTFSCLLSAFLISESLQETCSLPAHLPSPSSSSARRLQSGWASIVYHEPRANHHHSRHGQSCRAHSSCGDETRLSVRMITLQSRPHNILVLKIVKWNSQVLLDFWVVKAASNEPLGSIERVFGVGDSLALGWHSHQPLTLCGKSHYGGRRPCPLCIFKDLGIRAAHITVM